MYHPNHVACKNFCPYPVCLSLSPSPSLSVCLSAYLSVCNIEYVHLRAWCCSRLVFFAIEYDMLQFTLTYSTSSSTNTPETKRELLEADSGGKGGGGGGGRGFDVSKAGDTRVGFVGFPSVGKSTLLTKLTGTHSEAAAYEASFFYQSRGRQ